MPAFSSPNYIHLALPNGESSMQLMAMQEADVDGGSPCFNGPASEMGETSSVSYKSGSKPLTAITNLVSKTSCMVRLLLLAILLLLVLVCVLLVVIIKIDSARTNAIIPLVSTTAGSLISSTPAPSTTTTTLTPQTTTKKPEIPTCITPGCVRAANNLLNAMNQSADACSDFFEFACGAWNREHPIPDDMNSFGTFANAREQVRMQMRVLLESPTQYNSKSIHMAQTVYQICMNTTILDELNSSVLYHEIQTLGGWPLLDGKDYDTDSVPSFSTNHTFLTKLLSSTRNAFLTEPFVNVFVYADSKNTTQNTIFIDQGQLTLGRGARDYYLNETMFANQIGAYKKLIKEVLHLLQSDAKIERSDADTQKEIDELLYFETEIAKIIVPEDDRRNSSRMYNKRKIGDLYDLMPHIDWVDYFKAIAPDDMSNFFHNDTEIIVMEIEFLQKLTKLLSLSSARVIRNFVIWRVAHTTTKFLDERFEDIKQDYTRVMTGQQTRSPRWKDCALVPTTILPYASGALYTRAHFNSNDKQEALQMIGHLRDSFTELVKENDWMDSKIKTVAIEKAANIINHIGYPDFIQDDAKLDEKYKDLNIEPTDNYFDVMKKAVIYTHEKDFKKLEKPFDKFEFDVSPAVVNAFYSPEKNAITFPAGILQPPFFSGEFPKAVNYGAMGAVIGHEITHGFDDQGSQYDRNGNLQNWWNAESMARFNERKTCIVEQYSEYVVPGTQFKVNGKLTQGENIADNSGVKEAFRAYRKYISIKGSEEERLPGLQELTNDQIFFLSYAHFWCGHKKEAAAIQQVLTDEHSPELFRVTGVLSNLEEFSEAFKCSPGSPLNPAKKCRVW